MPYHFDRTGVRVMVMCPGVTDTLMISEAPRCQLQKEWGDEAGRELGKLSTQKLVLKGSGLSYIVLTNMTFFNTVAVNIYSSTVLQAMTSGFWMLVYLTLR